MKKQKLTREKLIERWENCLRVLQGLTPHQRREHWNMGVFGDKTECGTIACAAGHCGLDPWFRRRGFKMDFYEDKDGWPVNTLQCVGDDSDVDTEEFFGTSGARNIFFDSSYRSVRTVIKEVKAHIQWLRVTSDASGF